MKENTVAHSGPISDSNYIGQPWPPPKLNVRGYFVWQL
jgi:hypothetical protein